MPIETLEDLDLGMRIPMTHRPRRNRQNPAIREITQETRLHPSDLVVPIFVCEGQQQRQVIPSMPGHARLSIDLLTEEVHSLWHAGIRGIDLFAYVEPELRDPVGSEATNPDGLIQRAVKATREAVPDMWVMADVALDPFTNHGHDGVMDAEGHIINDASVEMLSRFSLSLAEAGVDMIAPSDMMDGRVSYIRQRLDAAGFTRVGILSYAAKYASAFYGPFRDALGSAPRRGDKRSYQLNTGNVREALLEAQLDEAEGADMLLVKPALPYLDILTKIKEVSNLPVGAYHVSGEYAMACAAAERGWIDGPAVLMESLLSIKRAGADFILTYAARDVLPLISD